MKPRWFATLVTSAALAVQAPAACGDELRCRSVRQTDAAGAYSSVMRCDRAPDYTGRDVAAWTSATVSVLMAGLGAVFQGIAVHQQNRLQAYAAMRDPVTSLPTVPWDEVAALSNARDVSQGLAIAGFVGAGIGAAVAATFWLLPRERLRAEVRGRAAGLAPVAVRPGGAGLVLVF